MRMSSKKGFVFTVDAFVALTLVILVIFVIVYQLNIPSAFFPQQSQTYNYARDVISTLSTLTIRDLKDNSDFSSLMFTLGYSDPVTTEDEHTVLEQIAKEAMNGNTVQAELIAQELLTSGDSPLLPGQFGAKITVDGQDIFIRDPYTVPFTRIQSSASYVLVGYRESRNPSQSRYDYPLDNPDPLYCNGGEGARPCVDPLLGSRYDAGTLIDAAIVRVSVWT